MDRSNQAVEEPGQNAAIVPGVEANGSQAPENDPEVRIAKLLEENAKMASDRDNYKKGLLAMKGKTEQDDLDLTDPVQLSAYIKAQVAEGVNATREAKAQEDLASYAKELARKNKEMALALRNKEGMSGAGQGSGENERSEAQAGYFSKEQVDHFKKLGWSDEKVKKAEQNMRKAGIKN